MLIHWLVRWVLYSSDITQPHQFLCFLFVSFISNATSSQMLIGQPSCVIKPCVGEVQRRLEEDPQACFRHVGVFVHAARPEHQQTVQPGKTVDSWNSCWYRVCVSERPLVFTKRDWTPSHHHHTFSHTAVTINMLQIIDHLVDLYSSIIQTSFIPWPHLVVTILSPFGPLVFWPFSCWHLL